MIRQVDILSSEVTTIAGTGIGGNANGFGKAASFQNPNGITTDGTNLYLADAGNSNIRQIALTTLEVSTLAGTGEVGYADGVGTAASFRLPNGLIILGANLYVSDSGNNLIRKIDSSTQEVSTFAGNVVTSITNAVDGVGIASKFSFPYGITTDKSHLYVADSGDRLIRKISIDNGAVSTLAGSGYFGSVDAKGTAASFNYPFGMTTDGAYLYVADAGNHKIRQIEISTGEVTTLAGSGAFGSANGVGTAASFSQPLGITTDNINLYVADTGSNKIRKIYVSTGEVSTFAGTGVEGSTDGDPSVATFNKPAGVTTDGINLYVADSGNNKIRRINIATAEVSTLAGSGNYWVDDPTTGVTAIGILANFRNPAGITTDGTNLYVADSDNNEIRKITPASGPLSAMTSDNAVVTTLSGSGVIGSTDGTGTEASFSQPVGITTDGTSLYTTEYLNNLIRKIQ